MPLRKNNTRNKDLFIFLTDDDPMRKGTCSAEHFHTLSQSDPFLLRTGSSMFSTTHSLQRDKGKHHRILVSKTGQDLFFFFFLCFLLWT